MGWLFSSEWEERRDLVAHLTHTETSTSEGREYKWVTLAHSVRGNVLWAVFQRSVNGKVQQPAIACFLLSKQRDYGWGYKDMTEAMHPYYYSCPLSYLELAPETCKEWREKVREYHAKARRKFQVGTTYALEGAKGLKSVEIVNLKPLQGIGDDGRLYRIPKKMIGKEICGERRN